MIISYSTYHIDRVKVCGRNEELLLRFRFRINLGLFDNLAGLGAIGMLDPKGAAARIAGVRDHSANSKGMVQKLLE